MSHLFRVGERLYEFEKLSDAYKARAQYAKPECLDQEDLETFLKSSNINFYLIDPGSAKRI